LPDQYSPVFLRRRPGQITNRQCNGPCHLFLATVLRCANITTSYCSSFSRCGDVTSHPKSAVLRERTLRSRRNFDCVPELAGGGRPPWESTTLKATTALLTLILVTAGCPAMAHQHRAFQNSDTLGRPSHLSCETIRAYVGQVGLIQAKAMALAAGMTASQERWATRCLAKKV
jgi:hypothetical protein